MVQELKDGGTFLLNCSWNMEELEKHLPGQVKRYLAEHNIKFYTIDGIGIGKEIGLGGRINTILQAAFFKLANIIPVEDAVKYMKDAATASYGKKGEAVVKMNHDAIDRGITDVKEIKVPEHWKDAPYEELHTKVTEGSKELVDFVNNILTPVNAQQGNELPVSAFADNADGTLPQGSSAYEKRGIAVDVPCWKPENCIQCNFCSYVCPHAVIRPAVMTKEEAEKAPEGMKKTAMTGLRIWNLPLPYQCLIVPMRFLYECMPGQEGREGTCYDTTGKPPRAEELDYGSLLRRSLKLEKFKDTTVKEASLSGLCFNSQRLCRLRRDTVCKLATQLFGERMLIANATGCSSIWGGSMPATPYTPSKNGRGPAWANSLFEDNAEYGYGMMLAQKTIRNRLRAKVEALAEKTDNEDIKAAVKRYIETYENGRENSGATMAYKSHGSLRMR